VPICIVVDWCHSMGWWDEIPRCVYYALL